MALAIYQQPNKRARIPISVFKTVTPMTVFFLLSSENITALPVILFSAVSLRRKTSHLKQEVISHF